MAPTMVSFDLVYYKLSETVALVDFKWVQQGFWSLKGIASQISENYEPP